MPCVKIEVTRGGVRIDQKQALIKGVVDPMSVAVRNFINSALVNVDDGLGAGHNLN